MTSLKFPDISVSAVEAGRAMKKLSEAMAKPMKKRESKNLIFKIQIVSVFPKWYAFTTKGITATEEEIIQSNWAFTSDVYTRETLKEKILNFEKKHKAKYQAIMQYKYKGLPIYDIVPNTHYILEVNTE